MTSSTVDIRGYAFRRQDHLLLDANVWLCVYGPVARRDWRTDVYGAALRNMRASGSQLYIDVLILSEFVNSFARWTYQQLQDTQDGKLPDFKSFRRSPEFGAAAQEIALNARRIVGACRRCDSAFGSVDIDDLLSHYATGRLDLNDGMLLHLCRREGLTLVTHDADFRGSDVLILTANKRLLSLPKGDL